MNQGLDDAEEDIERRRGHAGIGQAPRPYSGGGTTSEREPEKGHDERDGQDEDRADDRKGGEGVAACEPTMAWNALRRNG